MKDALSGYLNVLYEQEDVYKRQAISDAKTPRNRSPGEFCTLK